MYLCSMRPIKRKNPTQDNSDIEARKRLFMRDNNAEQIRAAAEKQYEEEMFNDAPDFETFYMDFLDSYPDVKDGAVGRARQMFQEEKREEQREIDRNLFGYGGKMKYGYGGKMKYGHGGMMSFDNGGMFDPTKKSERQERRAANKQFRQDVRRYETLAVSDPADFTAEDKQFIENFESQMEAREKDPGTRKGNLSGALGTAAGIASLVTLLEKTRDKRRGRG